MKKSVFIFIAFMVLLIGIAELSKLLKIHKITCTNQYGQCSELIVEPMNNVAGKDFRQARAEIENILNDNPLVDKYTIRYKLPISYSIYIIERKPKFAVYAGEHNFSLLGDNGTVLGTAENTNLPYVIIKSFGLSRGEKVDESLLFALKVTFDVYSLYQKQFSRIEGDSLIVELDKEITVIFPLEGDRKVLVGSLTLILNRLNSLDEGSKIEDINMRGKTIDLRFKNPVIR